MEVSVKRGKPRDQKTGCIIVAVHAGKTLSAAAHDLDKASRGAIRRLVDRGDLGNKPGDTVMLPDVHGIKGDRVLLVAAGRRNGLSPDDYRKLVTGAAATAGQPAEPRDGLTPEQRFFVGFAQWACGHMTDEEARVRALTGVHSPLRYRVNGVVVNLPEFAEAFHCKAGQAMVRDPADVCRIW